MGWGEKHITCFPDKLTLRSAQGCQDTASFLWESDWYLSCFSFSFFLPLQIQVHILFNLVEIRSRYKEIYWFCLIETFCHVLDLKLWKLCYSFEVLSLWLYSLPRRWKSPSVGPNEGAQEKSSRHSDHPGTVISNTMNLVDMSITRLLSGLYVSSLIDEKHWQPIVSLSVFEQPSLMFKIFLFFITEIYFPVDVLFFPPCLSMAQHLIRLNAV